MSQEELNDQFDQMINGNTWCAGKGGGDFEEWQQLHLRRESYVVDDDDVRSVRSRGSDSDGQARSDDDAGSSTPARRASGKLDAVRNRLLSLGLAPAGAPGPATLRRMGDGKVRCTEDQARRSSRILDLLDN